MRLFVYIVLAGGFAVLDWFFGKDVGPTGNIGDIGGFEVECDGSE